MIEGMNGLIQMTAHTVLRAEAQGLIAAGLTLAVLCALLAILALLNGDRMKPHAAVVFATVALIGTVMVVVGARMPRQKVLYCCASGPVSLETVAVRYDIIQVDGKLLKLAER